MGAGASAQEVMDQRTDELADAAAQDAEFGSRASEIAEAVRKDNISGDEFVNMSPEELEKRCRAADLEPALIQSLKKRLVALQSGNRERAGTF